VADCQNASKSDVVAARKKTRSTGASVVERAEEIASRQEQLRH
jgi:hypothetical protein